MTRTVSVVTALVAVALVVFGQLSARPTASSAGGPTPEFTLATTAGTTVSLADLRGGPVLIYFNEGDGCGFCTQQMAEIEKNPGVSRGRHHRAAHRDEQRRGDPTRPGDARGHPPCLLDDGTVSEAYGVLGAGMHEGLPGHGFVLIDAEEDDPWTPRSPGATSQQTPPPPSSSRRPLPAATGGVRPGPASGPAWRPYAEAGVHHA